MTFNAAIHRRDMEVQRCSNLLVHTVVTRSARITGIANVSLVRDVNVWVNVHNPHPRDIFAAIYVLTQALLLRTVSSWFVGVARATNDDTRDARAMTGPGIAVTRNASADISTGAQDCILEEQVTSGAGWGFVHQVVVAFQTQPLHHFFRSFPFVEDFLVHVYHLLAMFPAGKVRYVTHVIERDRLFDCELPSGQITA